MSVYVQFYCTFCLSYLSMTMKRLTDQPDLWNGGWLPSAYPV